MRSGAAPRRPASPRHVDRRLGMAVDIATKPRSLPLYRCGCSRAGLPVNLNR